MNNKNIFLLITLTLGALFFAIFFFATRTDDSDKDLVTIGILQTASHPALDKAREGFIETVTKELNNRVKFVIRNAEGSLSNAHVIAQSFHAHENIKAIFAIATPAAQAIASIEKEKPIFVAAVSNPQIITKNNKNICGASDQIAIDPIVTLIKQLLPKAQTVSLIAHIGDANSEQELIEIESALESANFITRRIGFTSEADVPTVIESACASADLVFIPNYNIVSSAMALVASIADRHQKPLIACDAENVKRGALAATGIDYFINGQQAGFCAIDILLRKKQPQELDFKQQAGCSSINKKIAEKLKIEVPDNYKAFLI